MPPYTFTPSPSPSSVRAWKMVQMARANWLMKKRRGNTSANSAPPTRRASGKSGEYHLLFLPCTNWVLRHFLTARWYHQCYTLSSWKISNVSVCIVCIGIHRFRAIEEKHFRTTFIIIFSKVSGGAFPE